MNHPSSTIRWGHALGWPGGYLTADADPLVARVHFLARFGLHSTDVSVEECADLDAPRRSRLAAALRDHDVQLTVRPSLDFFEKDLPELQTDVRAALARLETVAKQLPLGLVTVGAGNVHRFLSEPCLDAQLDRLTAVLTPLAAGCRSLGLRLGIENHGDYYVSDLVELCRRVPGLGIFLDTGNCCLIGEKPLDAAREAAPFVVGGHFKDHKVAPRPKASPLHFEVGNAVLGEGHVPLREIHEILVNKGPVGEPLRMEIEFFPANWNDPVPEFERCVAFLRSLEGGAA